jgi:hypothetical protein
MMFHPEIFRSFELFEKTKIPNVGPKIPKFFLQEKWEKLVSKVHKQCS